MQALQPAHDAESRAGVSVRVWRSKCYSLGTSPGWLGQGLFGGAVAIAPASAAEAREANSNPNSNPNPNPHPNPNLDQAREALATAQPALAAAVRDARAQLSETSTLSPPREPPASSLGVGLGGGSNDLLRSAAFDEARPLVLRHGCAARPAANASARARPLSWLLPAGEPFPRAAGCREGEHVAALCDVLKQVALRREVLAAVSNKNILSMLRTFLEGTRRAKITNVALVALEPSPQPWP